jgi:DNA-binding CsgD family transcriptional regulator
VFSKSQSIFAYLSLTNVDPGEWLAEITGATSVIGRSSTAQIRIPNDYYFVSRRHAQVWANRKGLWISDMGSKSQTALNGILIEPKVNYSLAIGDRIWLGGLELEVRDPSFVANNELDLEPKVQSRPTGNFPVPLKTEIPQLIAIKHLTHAELEIILWLRRGLTSLEELAEQLHRSPHTVRTQMASIFKKVGVHSRHELIAKLQRRFSPCPVP